MSQEIIFSVSGWCTQNIEILDKKYTTEKIVDLLNQGELITTMVQGHDSFIEDFAGNQIARIVDQDNECEYLDFDYKK